MKKCRKCDSNIPAKIKIENKVRNLAKRRYCFQCSPFGSKNRKKLELGLPTKESTNVICNECNKSYVFKRHSGMTIKNCVACVSRLSRNDFKRKAVSLGGGCCQKCGYNKSLSALDFHHLDPSTKDFGIGGYHGAWAKLVLEIEKCILLCRNCHAETHDSINKSKRPRGEEGTH